LRAFTELVAELTPGTILRGATIFPDHGMKIGAK
jgi:hypothetical protein